MNQQTVEKRFFFHANAVALAAHVRRPKEFFVPAVASSGLPSTGGIGTAEAGGKNFRDLISYESASTSVYGDFTNRERAAEFTHGNHGENTLPTVTIAEGEITGLEIRNGDRVFRADKLYSRLENFSDRKSESQFRSLTTHFEGLSVDGVRLIVRTHAEVLEEHDTKEKLLHAFRKDKRFRAAYEQYFFPAEPPSRGWFGYRKPALPDPKLPLFGTVVTGIHWEKDSARRTKIQKNRLDIEGLGSLYLGEMLVDKDFRRTTLLHFQLGSPDGGDGSAVDLQSNGTGWPPHVDS